jgi:hypothetical protein
VLWAHPFIDEEQLNFMYMQALNQGSTTFIRPSIAMVEGDSAGLLCEGHFEPRRKHSSQHGSQLP